MLVLWMVCWRRRRSQLAKEVIYPEGGSSISGRTLASVPSSSADSLSYIYDAGIPRGLN